MDWFSVAFGAVGLLTLLSAIYEWTWFWKLARGVYLPDAIGKYNTRVVYLLTGAGILGVG